jgi:hypothetical protein
MKKFINYALNIVIGLLLLLFFEGAMTLGNVFTINLSDYSVMGVITQALAIALTILIAIKIEIEN